MTKTSVLVTTPPHYQCIQSVYCSHAVIKIDRDASRRVAKKIALTN